MSTSIHLIYTQVFALAALLVPVSCAAQTTVAPGTSLSPPETMRLCDMFCYTLKWNKDHYDAFPEKEGNRLVSTYSVVSFAQNSVIMNRADTNGRKATITGTIAASGELIADGKVRYANNERVTCQMTWSSDAGIDRYGRMRFGITDVPIAATAQGDILVAGAGRIWKVSPTTGQLSVLLGGGKAPVTRGARADSVFLSGGPLGVTIDNAGNIYSIIGSGIDELHIVQISSKTNLITNLTGPTQVSTVQIAGQKSGAVNASFGRNLKSDARGNLFFLGQSPIFSSNNVLSGYDNNTLYKLADGQITRLAVGIINNNFAVAPNGDVFFQTGNNLIAKISSKTSSQVIVAGNGKELKSLIPDGQMATATALNLCNGGMVAGADSSLYFIASTGAPNVYPDQYRFEGSTACVVAIWKLESATGTLKKVATPPAPFSEGTMALDKSGSVYVLSSGGALGSFLSNFLWRIPLDK